MPGGEALQEVQVRAIQTVERITSLYPSGSSLLLCSHNFVNRTILCSVMGISLNKFRDLQQDPAALNILCKKEGHWVAEVVNDVTHSKGMNRINPGIGVIAKVHMETSVFAWQAFPFWSLLLLSGSEP